MTFLLLHFLAEKCNAMLRHMNGHTLQVETIWRLPNNGLIAHALSPRIRCCTCLSHPKLAPTCWVKWTARTLSCMHTNMHACACVRVRAHANNIPGWAAARWCRDSACPSIAGSHALHILQGVRVCVCTFAFVFACVQLRVSICVYSAFYLIPQQSWDERCNTTKCWWVFYVHINYC